MHWQRDVHSLISLIARFLPEGYGFSYQKALYATDKPMHSLSKSRLCYVCLCTFTAFSSCSNRERAPIDVKLRTMDCRENGLQPILTFSESLSNAASLDYFLDAFIKSSIVSKKSEQILASSNRAEPRTLA